MAVISIHAPREGGDQILQRDDGVVCTISIHAPREGGDFEADGGIWKREAFQSTPPARGATGLPADYTAAVPISIHAPREGGDPGS